MNININNSSNTAANVAVMFLLFLFSVGMLWIAAAISPYKETCHCNKQVCYVKRLYFNRIPIEDTIAKEELHIRTHHSRRGTTTTYELEPLFLTYYFWHFSAERHHNIIMKKDNVHITRYNLFISLLLIAIISPIFALFSYLIKSAQKNAQIKKRRMENRKKRRKRIEKL